MSEFKKSLSLPELRSYLEWLGPRLVGAQIQEVWLAGTVVCLDCYHGRAFTLALEMDPRAPGIFLLEDNPLRETGPKPIALFLKSHARGRRIVEVELLEERGRCVRIAAGAAELDVELIPRSPNIHVRVESDRGLKELSWEKPKERGAHAPPEEDFTARDWATLADDWLAAKLGARAVAGAEPGAPSGGSAGKGVSTAQAALAVKTHERALAKKRKALAELEASLAEDSALVWRNLGNTLLEVVSRTRAEDDPTIDRKLLDPKLGTKENMERAFEKAKQAERKKEGTRDRMGVLRAEIAKLAAMDEGAVAASGVSAKTPSKKKLDDLPQARQLKLPSGVVAYVGKSAADNLALLRAAKAWEYWVHLKDFPSAYGIIKRAKDQKIAQADIRAVAEWVFAQSKQGKSKMIGKIEVLLVECRHVRPIKGDKLGRVTFHHPQVFTFDFG